MRKQPPHRVGRPAMRNAAASGWSAGDAQCCRIGLVGRRCAMKSEMVDLSGPDLNQFFDTLEQWESLLQSEQQVLDNASSISATSAKEVK